MTAGMLRRLAVLIGVLVAGGCRSASTSSESQDVGESLKAIENCYHWAGEGGDQSAQRNKEIAEGINRDCPIARERARAAYSRYPKNKALSSALLKLIDIGEFKVTDSETKDICQSAASQVEADFSKSRAEDVLFRAVCPAEASKVYGR
jgi:hypothetical protein